MKWAWSEDPLKSQPEIKKTMSLEAFWLMLKHFRVVKPSALPLKQSVDYHPLQNINNGVIYLHNRALSMWQIGSKLCIDEGSVRSKIGVWSEILISPSGWAGQYVRLVTKNSMVADLFLIML